MNKKITVADIQTNLARCLANQQSFVIKAQLEVASPVDAAAALRDFEGWAVGLMLSLVSGSVRTAILEEMPIVSLLAILQQMSPVRAARWIADCGPCTRRIVLGLLEREGPAGRDILRVTEFAEAGLAGVEIQSKASCASSSRPSARNRLMSADVY